MASKELVTNKLGARIALMDQYDDEGNQLKINKTFGNVKETAAVDDCAEVAQALGELFDGYAQYGTMKENFMIQE